MKAQSPKERPTKKILVTVRDFRGQCHWTLATATKVGKRYKVASQVVNELKKDYPHGQLITMS